MTLTNERRLWEGEANQRRERAVFAMRWDVWSKSRIIWVSETLSEVLSSSSTCDISWHILNLCHHKVFFLHPWLTFFRQNMIRTTINTARRIPVMMHSVINKPSFVFSFIILNNLFLSENRKHGNGISFSCRSFKWS